MINARHAAVALLESNDTQWYVVGTPADIQRLHHAGITVQVWDIRLDNGHRPYPVARRWVNYPDDAVSPVLSEANQLTREIAAHTGITLAGNLFLLENTFLFRPTSSFWEDLLLEYAGEDGRVHGVDPADYYAIYRGYAAAKNGTIKFIRVEPDSADYRRVTPVPVNG